MDLTGHEVTVLGAGIAGLAVALALARRGAAVRVLEQAGAISDVGAGIQISANGAAVLRALGLADALRRAGTAASGVRLIAGETGKDVLRLDLAGRGFHFLHRADLVTLLEQAARAAGAEITLGARVAAVDLSGPQPVLTLADGSRVGACLLIGADGVQSGVRAALNGPAAADFTGQVAWRALLPCEPDAAPVAEVHMGPGRHLVSYPVRGGRLRNIVAVEERAGWAAESWSYRDDPVHLRTAFAGYSPRVQGWLAQIDEVYLWGLFRHPVARTWHGAQAAILGDAAHPTLPFLAQGANLALEDAWVLADCLARLDGPDTAFATYHTLRAARCARVIGAADRSGRLYHLRGPLRRPVQAGLRLGGRIAPALALSRFDWLYRHDVTQG